MGKTKTTIQPGNAEQAFAGSFYTISGCGGDLQEWVNGYGDWLKDAGIDRPKEWFELTGREVNRFAATKGEVSDPFPEDAHLLLFPLDGMEVGKLAMFKIANHDRWFDDIVQNMVGA